MDDCRIRQLRYRLQRLGMLELDAWLAPLAGADLADPRLSRAIERLLQLEAPELLAMMHGEIPIPEELREWLGR